MVGWNVKRRVLVCLISTVCFITIGLHSLTSINWTRKQFLGNGHGERILHRKETDSRQGSLNSARQLASYDNLSNGDPPDEKVIAKKESKAPKAVESNKVNATAKMPEVKLPTAKPVVEDIVATTGRKKKKEAKMEGDLDDEEAFTDCKGNGTLDMGGYPFIDARTVFCGEVPRHGIDSKNEAFVKAPGAITLSLLETMLIGKGATLQDGGNVPEMYIVGDKPIKLTDVSVTGDGQVVSAKQFSSVSDGRRKFKADRELQMSGGATHSTGALFFFPPLLSEYNILMKFLRTLYTTCATDGKAAGYAVTVQQASVHEKKLTVPFCVYFGLIGGGIKESYVIGTAGCESLKIPREMKLCVLKDMKL